MVVCDVHMPDTDGYAVLAAIRQAPGIGKTPVLAVTALAMPSDRERGLSAGFDGYLAKPIDPEAFMTQLHGFLRPAQYGVRRPEPEPIAPAPMPAPCARNGSNVLVVDDSPANRDLICQILESAGYSMRSAANVRHGLAFALESPPDLVVTDLHLPGEDGFHLLRAMKADGRLANIPVVVLTSSAWGQREQHEAMRLGARRFLVQPLEPQALVDEVGRCLAEGGARGDDPGR